MTDLLAQRGLLQQRQDRRWPCGAPYRHRPEGYSGTPMPGFGTQLSDADVAALVTYERNSFGNQTGDVVQPSAVKAARAK
ncbi:MAG: cytochrome c [Methylovirgula sp.]